MESLFSKNILNPYRKNNKNIIFKKDNEYVFFAVKKGTIITHSDLWIPLRLDRLDKLRNFEKKLYFKGSFVFKAGISNINCSFKWIYEKVFSSYQRKLDNINIPIYDENNGYLEFEIIALEDTELFVDKISFANLIKEEVQESDIINNIIFPDMNVCSEEKLYFNLENTEGRYLYSDKKIILDCGAIVDFTTYFNSFSSTKWIKYTDIKDVKLWLKFKGSAFVEIIELNSDGAKIVDLFYIESDRETNFIREIVLKDCIIGYKLYSDSNSCLYGGGFITSEPRKKNIKLGIGITTYKRENEVIRAVNFLSNAIIRNNFFRNKISIIVVDNGQTLELNNFMHATVIRNSNLGGTGGFMRSLIEFQKLKIYSHCLFMDDDASCEPESIFRAISFLEYSNDDSIAISGAMLSANNKFLQWEKGAWFDMFCHPLHCNVDLRDRFALFENDQEQESLNIYGAWWFFMFPLNRVEKYSFPFFVRGDDVEFSYVNNFNLVTMNGIASWQEDFKLKESPMTLYLDVRSHIIHHLLLKQISHNPFKIIKMVMQFFKRYNLAYQYDTAYAIVLAFRDIQKGPKYWIENLNTSNIRNSIKNIIKFEAPIPLELDYESLPYADNIRLRHLNKKIRKLTFNGHMIPSFLLKKKLYRIDKYETPVANRMFLRKNILVYNSSMRVQYILKRNSYAFIKNYIFMLIQAVKFLLRFDALYKSYNKFYQEHFSDDLEWKKFLNM